MGNPGRRQRVQSIPIDVGLQRRLELRVILTGASLHDWAGRWARPRFKVLRSVNAET